MIWAAYLDFLGLVRFITAGNLDARYTTRMPEGQVVSKHKFEAERTYPLHPTTMFLYFLLSVLSTYQVPPAMFDLAARDEPLCPESCRCVLK